MTSEEMLKTMGISRDEFADLLKRLSEFMRSLSSAQRAVVRASMPSFSRAAASFGPEATIADLQRLLDDVTPGDVTIFQNVMSGKNW